MKKIMLSVAGVLAVVGIAMSQPAHAEGCLRGAAVGGIAGHYVGHHGLIGAGIGCAWGHHEANKRYRGDVRDYRGDNRY